MNRILSFPLILSLFAAIVLSGCAAMESANTERLLTAAGFQPRTPKTEAQIQIYEAMTPYKVQRRTVHGKEVYVYADKKQGVVYIGGQAEYQRYTQMSVQQEIAQTNLAAAQINQINSMNNWDAWGPMGVWW